MQQTSKQNPIVKNLNYLLHRHVISQEQKALQKQQEKSLNKTTILPMIYPNARYNNISTQYQRATPISTFPHKRENDYRQTAGHQISGKEYIEVNKSILKKIEQKIYPMNKELTKKMKFKHNYSCETLRNSPEGSPDDSIPGSKKLKQKNKQKSKKKTSKELPKPGDISDEGLGFLNRQKRTKSQEQIIRLQAKVESYLRDRKKLLKFKYDQEMGNLVHNSLTSSKVAQSIKQQATQRTMKRLLTVHSSKKKKSKKQKKSSDKSLLIQKESELKRIIKLFEERANNCTELETGRQEKSKLQIIEQTKNRKDKPKNLSGVSSKDLSQSLKVISNLVNRKLEQVIDIKDAEVKDTGHREIIRRGQIQDTSKMSQCSNQSTQRKRILLKSKQSLNFKRIRRDDSQFKQNANKKQLAYPENITKSNKQQEPNQQRIKGSPTQRSTERRRTDKLKTEYSQKSGKSSQQNEKQNIAPISQEQTENKYDLKSEKSFKILQSKQGQALDKESLGEIQQQLLDEKKNLLKRKINEKKLMRRKKDSYIVGISIFEEKLSSYINNQLNSFSQ